MRAEVLLFLLSCLHIHCPFADCQFLSFLWLFFSFFFLFRLFSIFAWVRKERKSRNQFHEVVKICIEEIICQFRVTFMYIHSKWVSKQLNSPLLELDNRSILVSNLFLFLFFHVLNGKQMIIIQLANGYFRICNNFIWTNK